MAAEERDMNRDPITDEPGAHPVGTGVGAAGGAMAGASMGVIGGPIGMAIGGVVGAVVGGLTGKAVGEAVNPTAEEAHWRDNYNKESYYEAGRSYDDYAPAYQLGMNGRSRYQEDWDAAEPKMASEWESARGGSSLSWPQAQQASRAAWNRVDSQSMGNTKSGMSDRGMGTSASMSSSSGSNMSNNTMGSNSNMSSKDNFGSGMTGGAAGMVGGLQSAGIDEGGGRDDAIDVLNDLAECSKDGEYGFRACAEQAERQDLKTMFTQRADDCRSAAQELYQHIRSLGGTPDEGGSATGAIHRGWVSVKAALSVRDDLSVLEECERGEDVALARYRKAMKQNLPANVKQLVEKQMQGVQKNHDQIKMLRDQFKAAS